MEDDQAGEEEADQGELLPGGIVIRLITYHSHSSFRVQELFTAPEIGTSQLIRSKSTTLEASKISISKGMPFSSRWRITPSAKSMESTGLPSRSSKVTISTSSEYLIRKVTTSFVISLLIWRVNRHYYQHPSLILVDNSGEALVSDPMSDKPPSMPRKTSSG